MAEVEKKVKAVNLYSASSWTL